jgi:hypothetical protein
MDNSQCSPSPTAEIRNRVQTIDASASTAETTTIRVKLSQNPTELTTSMTAVDDVSDSDVVFMLMNGEDYFMHNIMSCTLGAPNKVDFG